MAGDDGVLNMAPMDETDETARMESDIRVYCNNERHWTPRAPDLTYNPASLSAERLHWVDEANALVIQGKVGSPAMYASSSLPGWPAPGQAPERTTIDVSASSSLSHSSLHLR